MIVRLTGIISEVHETYAVLDRDGIGYQVLVPGFTIGELTARRGQTGTLHTMEYYEGAAAGGNLIPRLVGFLHPEDRAFFERFITVKGMGVRKALKAMSVPTGTVAAAIEAGDAKALTRLPGIGARAADQIVAELKGKVGSFAIGATGPGEPPPAATTAWKPDQRDALEVMIALGERRADAERWIERATQVYPDTQGPDEWVRVAYRIRSGAEGR